MKSLLLVLTLALATAGCIRLRTDPEAGTPAASRAVETPVPPPKIEGPLDVRNCVELALAHAPSLRSARARADAAAAGIDLAGTAYLPRVDLVWQEIRATRNNISGTTFPQGAIPAISGPVGKSRSWDSGWGSNAGALLSYEPLDFGLRSANVEVARLAARQAELDIRVTRLDAAAGAAEAFLAHLAALQTLRAARANLDRWDVFAKAVHTLTDRDLRPGAEASRADAEVAAARTQLFLAEQTVQISRVALAESMGTTELPGDTDPGPLLDLPSQADAPADPSSHPLLARQSAAVDTAQARREALDHAYAPRLNLLLGINARGSGFDPTGAPDADDGLFPTRPNWAAGVSLTFGVLDCYSIRARQRAEEGSERAERARADEIYLALKMQAARVQAVLDAARKIAGNTPVQLQAANEAHARARARYDTGLGTLTEVAEAQRLLAQSEIDDALARLAIWRTLAAGARAQGDLDPFLRLVAASKKEKK
jgi:outer membrane protein TolC